jgi:hypothetical protein
LRVLKYISHGTAAIEINAVILNHWIGFKAINDKASATNSNSLMLRSWMVLEG